MFVRLVARHQIQTDADAHGVGFADELYQLGVGAEAGVDAVEIGDVVTPVLEFALEDGTEPDGVHTETLDVGEFGADTLQIADAVAVAVFEGRRIDMVQNSLLEPFGDLLGRYGQQEERGCPCKKDTFHQS